MAYLKRDRQEGLYEMLEHDAVLELGDPKGETALYKKHQRVRFLQNNAVAFRDFAWGNGRILEEFTISTPSVPMARSRTLRNRESRLANGLYLWRLQSQAIAIFATTNLGEICSLSQTEFLKDR